MSTAAAARGALEILLTDAAVGGRRRFVPAGAAARTVGGLAPTNFPLTNPAVLREIVDHGGTNLARGARALVRDVSRSPRLPASVDTSSFAVGENLATSKGSVVLRTDVFELIQYRPLAPDVHEVPMLIVPPTINKFYVLDLAPGRSLIEHLLGEGQQVFVISWRNPGPSTGTGTARPPRPSSAAARTRQPARRPGAMSTPREPERWWGRPVAESRWALELARLSVDPIWLGRDVAKGDGRPVVLMPGFLTGDPTLFVLASWLRRIGHRPYGCGFVANVDCSDRALERVERRVEQLHRRHGRRVALVGHSRGGHFARALAHRRPDRVSHAVALGADLQRMFGISVPTQAAVVAARRGVAALRRGRAERCLYADCTCAFARDFTAPIPTDRVRFTSVYSKGDGVVHWRGSVIAGADNVEVTGSHIGLIFNRKAYRAIADALALPEIT